MASFGQLASTVIADLLKAFGLLGGLLSLLQAQGISTGSIGSLATQTITNTEAYETDIANGQGVVVASVDITSDAPNTSSPIGTVVLVAMTQGGTAYQSLFGSST